AAQRPVLADVLPRGLHGEPFRGILQGGEETVKPAIAVAKIEGPRPRAKLFAIIPHGGHAAGTTLGALTKETDGLFAGTERQQIAQGLQSWENPHRLPAVFAHIIPNK